MPTILKSFAVCVLLLAGWHVLVNRLPTKYRAGGSAGSQQEQNIIRGESFVYAAAQPRVVVVGSSIANRLKHLPRDWFNLSFNGGSPFTGLEMIGRSGRFPDIVLVETNMLLLPADHEQLEELFAPGVYQARRRVAFLAETNKPHLIAQRALIGAEERVAQRDPNEDHRGPGPSSPAAAQPPTESDAAEAVLSREQFEMLAVRRAEELAEPLDRETLDRIVSDLQRHVGDLEKRGVRVVFFEMPEHAEFVDKPRPASVRRRLREMFPADRYSWVPDVDRNTYRTTDFVHLTTAGSRRYAEVLKRHVAALAPAGQPAIGATALTSASPAPARRARAE